MWVAGGKEESLATVKKLLVTENEAAASADSTDLARTISKSGAENDWNVILICMESMSGDFMSYVGNKNGLLVPATTTDQELQHLRNSLPGTHPAPC